MGRSIEELESRVGFFFGELLRLRRYARHVPRGSAVGRALAFLAVGLAAALGLAGCGQSEKEGALPSNALAVVEGRIITVEAFQNELARRARVNSGREAETKEKYALLEEMIRFEAAYQTALAAGYDRDPQISANLKRMIVDKYKADQLAKLPPPQVGAQEIAEYYRQNPRRFGSPATVRVALIEFKVSRTASAEKRAETARRAAAVLAQAKAGSPADGTFGLLAQNHSEDQSSRYRGGDIGWLTTGDTNAPWPPAVLEAIYELKQPGDCGPVIETPKAFYLVKLIERRPDRLRPLDEVKEGIKYLVAREKEEHQAQALYNRFRQGLEIRTNAALLESIRKPVNENRPPGTPGTFNPETRAP